MTDLHKGFWIPLSGSQLEMRTSSIIFLPAKERIRHQHRPTLERVWVHDLHMACCRHLCEIRYFSCQTWSVFPGQVSF